MPAASEIYLAAVERVTARALTWSAVDAATPVPACPGWSAHDLLAHLAGGAADHAANRLDGFPGSAWTKRHIAERSDRSTAELVAELWALAPLTAAGCDRRLGAPNSSWDAYIHAQDLAGAFEVQMAPLDDHGHELLGRITAFLASDASFVVTTARVENDLVRITVNDAHEHVAVVEARVAFCAIAARSGPGAATRWSWLPAAPPPQIMDELSLF